MAEFNNNDELTPVAPIYSKQTAAIIEALDTHIITTIKNHGNPDYYNQALLGLWYIIKLNIFFTIREVDKIYNFYPVAGAVRLIMECVADAKYLQSHQEEAEAYFNTQQKIQEEMKNLGSKSFNLFKSGDINKYGELSAKTLSRLKKAHGSDGLGAYSFLCCFTHPNIAGVFWFVADKDNGWKNLYAIEIMNAALATWLKVLEESSIVEVSATEWSQKLIAVHQNTLGTLAKKDDR